MTTRMDVTGSFPARKDDGLLLEEVRAWSEEKYRLVQHYAAVFCKSVRKKWDCLIYLDLFSGPGRSRIDHKRIPQLYKNRNQLYATGLFHGSFGVRIVTSDESDLAFQDTEHALLKLVKLLEESDDLQKLSVSFKELNLLSRSRFLRFLRSLVDNELSIKLDWANRLGHLEKADLQLPRIKANLAYLEATSDASSDTRTVPGILEAVSVIKRRFEFQEDAGQYIRGEIDKKLLGNLREHDEYFRVPYPIMAKLREEMKVNAVTGEETWHHILVDFELPDNGAE